MRMKGFIGWIVWIGLAGVLVIGAVNRIRSSDTEANGYDSVGRQDSVRRNRGELSSPSLDPTQSAVGVNGEDPAEGEYQGGEILPAVVLAVSEQELLLEFPDRLEARLTGRPWRYAQEQGFKAQVGDQLQVSVYYPTPDQLEIARLENISQGIAMQLRD